MKGQSNLRHELFDFDNNVFTCKKIQKIKIQKV